jgi:threonylcarbamoyladenosine tRNA methylthiotransferase CDKAL1
MRAYIESYGCTLNQGEACEIRETLLSLGWRIVPDLADADLSVLVACVVIEATENRMLRRLKELSTSGRVIVTGCLATARKEAAQAISPRAEFVPPGDLSSFSAVVGRIGPEVDRDSGEESGVAIVPIATGCRGECSYCITRLARGALRSRSPEDIVSRIADRTRDGPLEVRITAQDSAAYGQDLGTDLISLMERVSSLKTDFRVRLGMMNPDSVLPLLGRLPGLYSDPRVFRFLHLPVQSASDVLLSDMGRRYVVADFEKIVSAFRGAAPDATLSTDIIVGYPGESEADHEANLGLIRRVRPDIVNVTRYSPRPGTKAFELGRGVVGWKAKDRSRELTEARFEVSLARNNCMVGSSKRALATERGKDESTILRTDEYRQVVVRERLPLRRYYDVVVEETTPTYLIGGLPAGNR